jgi:hypothetical protein
MSIYTSACAFSLEIEGRDEGEHNQYLVILILNFLDITGNWDPSLIFVMIGALAVAFVSFKFILKSPAPVLADRPC